MLSEGGKTVGFRGGMIHRAGALSTHLATRASQLDKMFLFSSLVQKDGTIPPVIVQASDVAAFSADQIRTANQVYKIEREERFVSVPPTWRDYLYAGLPVNGKVELPVFEARPRSTQETVIWREAVQSGWTEGEKQADAVLEANFQRLTRDYTGMLLFASLRHQGIITGTRVAELSQTASGDGKRLVVGDKLRRLTGKALFVVDPGKWRPTVKGNNASGVGVSRTAR